MAEYVRGRAAYQTVFPWFYETIREEVLTLLRPQYPDAEGVVGVSADGMTRGMAKFPGVVPPCEWVAFSFGGLALHDFHIGVVLDLDHWPVTYSVGLHIMDEALTPFKQAVDALDWASYLGHPPQFTYAAQVRESRWIDPTREMDFSDLRGEVEHIVERVARYYRAAAPVAALCP